MAEILLEELRDRHLRVGHVTLQHLVVRHQTAVHLRRGIVRIEQRRLLESDRILVNQVGDAVQLRQRLAQLVAREDRMQQDMAEVVELSALVQQLNDVESELRLDDLGNLAGLQPLQRPAERLVETRQRRGVHLAAANGRTVLRIHAREALETGFARDDALAHVQQPLARTLLGLLHRLGELGDLRIDVLIGDQRQAVLRDRLVEAFDLARDHRHLVDHLLLHPAGIGLLLVALAEYLAEREDRHVVLGLQFRDRALQIDHLLHLVLDARQNAALVDLHRVDLRLVVKQFLRHQPFERLVHRVAVGGVALLPALLDELPRVLVHLGVEDRRPAHHGHHLVEHHLPPLGRCACGRNEDQCRQYTFFKHARLRLVSIWSLRCPSPPDHRRSPRRSPRRGRKAPPRDGGSPRPAAG